MRFPSLSHLGREAGASFFRFPLVLLGAAVAATGGILATHDSRPYAYLNVLLAAQLSIPLLFAVAVVAQRHALSAGRRVVLAVAGAAAIVAYHFSLPDWITPTAGIRFVQFNAGVHLLAAFLPYAVYRASDGFWQYNKTLFIRFLIAALYSAVLFAGLSVALFAIDQLLGVNVDDKLYADLFAVIALVFNTWFFVGGIPRDLASLDASTDYPRGLKVFTQYILVPIVLVYLAILTIYLVKVVVTRQWPSGMIGYLVSAVSIAGILSLLLVHPIRESAENRWIRSFSRWFYVWLLPAIGMLLMATGKRVEQYGITENRYFLAVLAVWLLGISLYFILGKGKRIRVIPFSLCIVAFVTSFGPWGAYSVSRASQVARLSGLLEENHILVDGRIVPATSPVPFSDRREISAVLTYLVTRHGTSALRPWFGDKLAETDTSAADLGPSRANESTARVKSLLESLGVEYVAAWQREGKHFAYNADNRNHTYDLAGYEHMFHFNFSGTRENDNVLEDSPLTVSYRTEPPSIFFRTGSDTVATIEMLSLIGRVDAYSKEHSSRSTLPPGEMLVASENERIRVAVYVALLNGTRDGDRVRITHVNGDVFYTIK